MASRQITTYVSDISGDQIDSVEPTVAFGLDGANYEIDLTVKEAERLRAELAPYVAVARQMSTPRRTRRPSRRPTRTSRSSPEPTPQQMRAWARENGFEVPDRGRIPALVVEAFHVAH